MNIGLFGISGVYNFGCEAIIRGSYTFLKNCFPGSKIMYFSLNSDYDKQKLSDLDIEIIPVKINSVIWKRIINKGLRLINASKQLLMFESNKYFASIDILISVGGDLYTIPKIKLRKNKYPYHNILVDVCNQIIANKKIYIIFGASIGPFGSYRHALNYYKKSLKKCSCIICREQESIMYLNSLGIKDAFFMPDPAFLVTDGVKNIIYNENGPIGLNLSYLSLFENIGRDKFKDKMNELVGFINEIYYRIGKKIVLIPHVVYNDEEKDNDYLFMQKIYDQLDSDMKKNIRIADASDGFMGIKKIVRNCSLVISARMHCCINAICENIPTVFISYSSKSQGMCQFVYGNCDYMISIEEINKKTVSIVKKIYLNRNKINEYLIKRNIEILKMYNESKSIIRQVIVNDQKIERI